MLFLQDNRQPNLFPLPIPKPYRFPVKWERFALFKDSRFRSDTVRVKEYMPFTWRCQDGGCLQPSELSPC